jgi:hypothetical protein
MAARPPSGGRAHQRRAPRRRRHPPPSVTVSGSHLWISLRLEKWGGERSKKERGGGRGHEPALLALTLAGQLPAMDIAEPAAITDVRRHRWRWGSGWKKRRGRGRGLVPWAPPIAVAGAPPAMDIPSPAAASRICREAGEERMESRVSRGRQTRFYSRDLRGYLSDPHLR